MITEKLDKSKVVITPLQKNDEKAFWATKSPLERLRALELNRKIVYGYSDNPPRLQRFFEIIKQSWS
ncbi:MAG: hypothetical protein PF638_07855 [Candidatus Delongbacteria bacterium]|nr:hypothetical protein [Candidatus Delongbacteria bacterium]